MEVGVSWVSSDVDSSRRRFLKELTGAATAGVLGLSGCLRLPQQPGGPYSGPSGAAGPVGERFYQSEPPRERGQTITATDYSSLQDAHDALSPNSSLYIPASGGPYREQLNISQDSITVMSDGAWIEQSGGESWALGSSSPARNSKTSLAQPVAGGGAAADGGSEDVGDTTLHVSDSSVFSPGDDIYIFEDGRAYGEPSSGGAPGPNTISEYRTVTAVDRENDIVQVHHPMFLPYPLENRTEVGHVEWTAQDVRVTGLNVRGRPNAGSGSHVVEFGGIRNGWFDNLRIEDSADDSLAITSCYQCRTDDIRMIGGNGYGIQIRGSTHTYCTNSVGDGIMNYTVRAGGSAVDILADGVDGRNYQSSNEGPVAASHWGGFYITYRNVTVEGEQLVRFRTRHMIVEDFDVSQCATRECAWSQRPFHVIVRNGRIGDYPSGANEYVFHFRLRGDDSPLGNEEGGNIRIENVQIEQQENYTPDDIGLFSDGCVIDGLYIRNVTYGGQNITRQHVEQWDGFGQASVSNLVVE